MTTPGEVPLSVVVVGYGLGGRVFHAPLVSATPGLFLAAIVTANGDRRALARAAYPDVALYDTADEAWSAGHDLAVISTANVTHVPLATAALEAGLPVVLDKPIAPTAAQAEQLRRLAADQGRQLIPFQNRRWDSDFLTAVQVAGEGVIGRVHRFESRIERMRVVPKAGWKSSTEPSDMGGMLYDLGAHLVDQALQLMGPVHSVMAFARSVRVVKGADDDVLLVLMHVDGAVSHLVASQVSAFGEPRLRLLGTRGGLRITASDTQEAALAAGRTPGDAEWGLEPAGSEAELRVYDDASTPTDNARRLARGNWPAFYTGVESALRGRSGPPVHVEDAVQSLRILDAARESAAAGRLVSLDPPAAHRGWSTS
jgi:predicted dehydrogenase